MWHDLSSVERVGGLAFVCRSLLWRVLLWLFPVMKFGFLRCGCLSDFGQSFHMWITLRNWTLDLLVPGEFRVCLWIPCCPLCVVCFLGEDGFRRLLLKSTREDDECHFQGSTPSTRDRRFPRACFIRGHLGSHGQVHLLPWRISALD